jgi:hypothetical protein
MWALLRQRGMVAMNLKPIESMSYDRMRELEIASNEEQYPDGLDLRPGKPLHDRIVEMVLEYAQSGYDTTTDYVPEYQRVENVLDGYMPASEVDRMRLTQDPKTPVNVVVPMLYAHQQLFLAAMHRAFFSHEAFHRYAGHGSPERAAKALMGEKVQARITQWFHERRAADIHWGDSFAYGRAFAWGKWSKRTAPTFVDEDVDEMLSMVLQEMGADILPGERVRYLDEERLQRREGTDWRPLDPYQVLTDPDTTPDRFQESAFFGWTARTDALLIQQYEGDPEEGVFNCKALRAWAESGNGTSKFFRESVMRNKRVNNPGDPPRRDRETRCDVLYMFARLIPSQCGLGDSDRPELWFFKVGGDRILIGADRVKTRHGGMPIICAAPNARGHEISPVSNLMITLGQQMSVDFLVKRRMDFLDTVLNGKFVIDSQFLEWRDFKRGGGPMVIRTKKRAMGRSIKELYEQMQTEDVTGATWADVAHQIELAKEGNGITEQASAMPERPTARGIDAIEGRSVGRMARIALIIDEQSRQPMAYQNLCNTAQWMSTEVLLDITGREDELIRQSYGLPPGATGLLASAWDIDPDLDVVPLSAMSSGTQNIPAMTEFAKTLLGAPGALELFVQQFRLEEFLVRYFKEMGLTDIDWYRHQPGGMNITPMPNEAIQQQVQAGNLVPAGMQSQGYGM